MVTVDSNQATTAATATIATTMVVRFQVMFNERRLMIHLYVSTLGSRAEESKKKKSETDTNTRL